MQLLKFEEGILSCDLNPPLYGKLAKVKLVRPFCIRCEKKILTELYYIKEDKNYCLDCGGYKEHMETINNRHCDEPRLSSRRW